MDERHASNTSDLALAHNFHSRVAAAGIWRGNNSLELSHARTARDRNIPTSAEAEKIRGRQILEQLLASALVENPKGLAGDLIGQYGSLSAVLVASAEADNDDPRTAFLGLVQAALVESLRSKIEGRPIISRSADLVQYLKAEMAYLDTEQVRVLFLNVKNHLMCDEVMGRGSISEAPIYPREILKRAILLNASAIILAHNHPSGDATPSRADILATRRLKSSGEELGITVHDHVILSSSGWSSLKELGYL